MRTVLLPLFLAAALWFAAGRVCLAQQEIKFPEKAPLVSFTVPKDWVVEEERGGDFPTRKCELGILSGLTITLLHETYSEADFRQKLPDLIKAKLAAFGFNPETSGLDLGPVTNRPLGDKIQAVSAEAKFKAVGDPYRAVVSGFTVDGKSMLAICCLEQAEREPAALADTIRNSFKPLK